MKLMAGSLWSSRLAAARMGTKSGDAYVAYAVPE